MNSLGLLAILTVLAAAWSMRALYLDAARQRRRADRLAARNVELRQRLEFLLDELDDTAVLLEMAARDRHTSRPSNVKVLRGVK